MKKLLTIILITVLGAGNVSLVYAQPPGLPTIDIPNLIQNAFSATQDAKGVLKEFKLDKIPLKIAKKLLDKMTDSVVVWAAGGFKKEGPAFISNFDEYAEGLAIQTGTLLIDEIVKEGEEYASKSLTTAEQQELKKCNDVKKEYDQYYSLLEIALFDEGIAVGGGRFLSLKSEGGVAEFNTFLNSLGYPSYVLGNGQYNKKALKTFLEEYIMSDPVRLRATGLTVGFERMQELIRKLDVCQKTLFIKVTGLTYTNDLVKFIGETYRNGRRGSASRIGLPNFENFGSEYIKALSSNWKSFKTDASAGGWAAWGESAKLENTPWGAKYLAQAELSNTLAQELGQKSAQLQRSGGFLDKGECAEYREVESSAGNERICVDYQANTPGTVIREAVNKRILQQYDQLNNADDWTDLLLTTSVKLVDGILREGVLPLANNAIDKGLACLAGSCDEDIYGKTNVASSQTITNSGGATIAADDVVDIKNVLYGPLVLEKDANDNIIYERRDPNGYRVREKRNADRQLVEYVAYNEQAVPQYRIREQTRRVNGVDTLYYTAIPFSGRPQPFGELASLEPTITIDYSRPQYAFQHELDASGSPRYTVLYETHPLTGALVQDYKYKKKLDASGNETDLYEYDSSGNRIILRDANGNAVLDPNSKIPKYKRENGSIELAATLQQTISAQHKFVGTLGVRRLMALDQGLPGPDLGWDGRLDDKVNSAIDAETNPRKKSALREIYDTVKRTFEAGITGSTVDDTASDVVLVRGGAVYTNPQYTFLDFKYPVTGPGTIPIGPTGAPLPQTGVTAQNYQALLNKTFPKKMILTRADDRSVAEYDVVSMNTYAGLWFNPTTKQVEAVGNIPEAQSIRELTLAVESQFTDVIDTYRRRGTTLRTVQSKLKQLQVQYESLPYISPASTLEQRAERTKKENQIAYEISLIRGELPIYDDVVEEKSKLKSLLVNYDLMGEMLMGTTEYRSQDGYAVRFGDLQQYRGTDVASNDVHRGLSRYHEDAALAKRYEQLYLKDKMGLLYCGFQDHSKINTLSSDIRQSIISEIVQQERQSGLRSLLLLSPLALGVNAIFGNNQTTYDVFGGFASVGIGNEEYRSSSMRRETYEYTVPYRCYETSVICNNGDDEAPCGSYQCPIIGHNTPGESFLMASIKASCAGIYRSSIGDYLDLIDPDSR